MWFLKFCPARCEEKFWREKFSLQRIVSSKLLQNFHFYSLPNQQLIPSSPPPPLSISLSPSQFVPLSMCSSISFSHSIPHSLSLFLCIYQPLSYFCLLLSFSLSLSLKVVHISLFAFKFK